MMRMRALFLASAGITAVVSLPQKAVAQSDPAAEASAGASAQETAAETPAGPSVEDIVVTARKQEEKLIDTPVTVTALTEARIEAKGLTDFRNIAYSTPGVNITPSFSGRWAVTTVFRGMTPSISANSSVFIDGTPVTSGIVEMAQDSARIEVLKGPQTAYFGRSTFAGAINFVTKAPSKVLEGKADLIVGSDNLYEGRLSVEGPIIKDLLTARVSGRYFTQDGTLANAAGGTLGDQETKMLSLALRLTPTPDLTVSAFGFIQRDDDGPTSLYKVTRPLLSCNAGAAPTNVNNYICGTVPNRGQIPLGTNAGVTPTFRNLVLNNAAGTFNPLFRNQFLDHGGYARKVEHAHLTIDYDFGGAQLTSLSSINRNREINILDLDFEDSRAFPRVGTNPNAPAFNDFPARFEQYYDDMFQELRLASSGDSRLRWLIGGSYSYSETALYSSVILNAGIPLALGLGAMTVTKTPAVFGSLSYEFSPQITLSVEGRYQEDKVASYRRTRFRERGAIVADPTGVNQAKATFKKFTPRIILQYRPVEDTMIYASYAEGTNPGTFNTQQFAFPAQQEQILAQAGAGLVVRPETLKNYELGIKSQFWDGRAQILAAAYYAKWTDQIVPQNVAVGTVNLAINTNIGSTELKGFEIEAEVRPIPQLLLSGLFAYNGSEIKDYVCVACRAFAGPNVSVIGNSLPRSSRYSASVGGEYRESLGSGDWEGFGRIDYNYKGRQFADETNLAESKPQNLVNLRLGAQSRALRVEGFITNAFNNRGATGITRSTDGLRGGATSFILGAQELRRFGIRASYKFGG